VKKNVFLNIKISYHINYQSGRHASIGQTRLNRADTPQSGKHASIGQTRLNRADTPQSGRHASIGQTRLNRADTPQSGRPQLGRHASIGQTRLNWADTQVCPYKNVIIYDRFHVGANLRVRPVVFALSCSPLSCSPLSCSPLVVFACENIKKIL